MTTNKGGIMWLSTSEASTSGVEEVAGKLRIDIRNGLWWEEADQRRNLFGYNELTFKEEEPTWKKYLEQVITLTQVYILILHYC